MRPFFESRSEAGILLAEKLKHIVTKNTLIVGLPRGGVAVAAEISKKFGVPLGVIIAKKIRHPRSPEFSIGAVAEGGGIFIDPRFEKSVTQDYLRHEIAEKEDEIARYSASFGETVLYGRECIIVDDGIATGNTIGAAINSARNRGAKEVRVAVPVLPARAVPRVRKMADMLFYLDAPDNFYAVGGFYRHFPQLSTEEVVQLLDDISGAVQKPIAK